MVVGQGIYKYDPTQERNLMADFCMLVRNAHQTTQM